MQPFTIHPETSLGPVRLMVADLKRSLEFYSGLLGMQATPRGDGTVGVGAGETTLLLLAEQPGAQPKPPQATGLYHVALLLPSRPDLGRMIQRFAETRYPLSGASDHLVSEALYLNDPDGNGLEIYADRPRETWVYAHNQVRMVVDPLDIDDILGEIADDSTRWSGMPIGSRVGHVHLQVHDLPSSEAFYCGVLGFDVVARYGPGALFVSAGGYHHHLGLNTWAGVGAPPPPTDAAGLGYLTIQLPNRVARDAVVARAHEAGVASKEIAHGILVRDPAQNGILISSPT
ncbi:MAG: VOC family protein [Oscillochloris sp.]|nr:VOC family protein [Oscillochloris sp.]